MSNELIAQARRLSAALKRINRPDAFHVELANTVDDLVAALEAQQAGGEPVAVVIDEPVLPIFGAVNGQPVSVPATTKKGILFLTDVSVGAPLYTAAPVQQVDALRTALMHIEGAAMDASVERRAIRDAARAALAAQPAAERVPFDPLAEFGFMLEQRRDVWVVVDDCGGTTPASLTERVMWDAIVKSRGITATSGKESRHD